MIGHNLMNKIKLFNNITSLYKLNYECSDCNIWIKRDDNIDFAFGGNKVRLYEYIAQYILDCKVDRIVTFGSPLSNYLRVTAIVCAKLGIDCDLIILDDSNDYNVNGNLKLISNFNANIILCEYDKAHDFIDSYQDKLKKNNVNYLWIPGGGHMAQAAFGYVDASEEIKKQLMDNNCKIDAIFLPCGTGTTQAGLVYGFADMDIDIIGITVARSTERCLKEIDEILRQMQTIEGKLFNNYKYNVIDNDGTKYGKQSESCKAVARELANLDGIFLDPIYNAKAFDGMLRYIKKTSKYKNVLYINTGGTPNIFTN